MRRALRDEVESDVFTASGQTRVFTGRIAQTNQPVRVTLAWTDAPAALRVMLFNNDLDLTVEVGGSTYLGNRFSGAYSIVGGSTDARTTWRVMLPAGISGDITVTITAANINSDGVPKYGSSLIKISLWWFTMPRTPPCPGFLWQTRRSSLKDSSRPTARLTWRDGHAFSIALRNTGTLAASNLIVSLLATNGISSSRRGAGLWCLASGRAAGQSQLHFCCEQWELRRHDQSCAATSGCDGQPWDSNVGFSLGLKTIHTANFTNNTAITIPDSGKASVYPSAIVVSKCPELSKVTATLKGYSHFLAG